uniref:UPAR/Ly6 domain-containing protein qvr n=1 Tax=Aceria tosichella TaxID=561515 RepID=A0A6G1SPW6_9ACAR
MLNAFIKLLVSELNNLLLLVALTGFVCTYKIQAEEECLSSNVLCYECDSRYDPNCADPFEFSSISLTDQQQSLLTAQANNNSLTTGGDEAATNSSSSDDNRQQQSRVAPAQPAANKTYKRFPTAPICHGCCVKITSKTPEGATYVKRTCTTNLQINYFMVGLVCMKESGDRGKMCFCETDYCNGVSSESSSGVLSIISVLMIGLIISARLVPPSTNTLILRCRL